MTRSARGTPIIISTSSAASQSRARSARNWNGAAFFLGNFWVLHRKQSTLFFVYFVIALSLFVGGVAGGSFKVGVAFWALLSFVVFPVYADGLYYLHARRLIDKAKQTEQDPAARILLLRNDGLPPGKKHGISWPEWSVVAIAIGTLAGVACGCGGYQDYTLRAKCAEAVLVCWQVKTQVNEFALKNGRLPASFNELEQPPPRSTWVKSLELQQDATIVATLQGTKEFDGKMLVFRPTLDDGEVTWVCGTPEEMSFYKYLPAECRKKLAPDGASS